MIVSEFVTLDGITDAPDEWSLQFFDEGCTPVRTEGSDAGCGGDGGKTVFSYALS